MPESVTVYTSTYCLHSRSVVRFLKKNNVPAEIINIDGNREAKEFVMAINNGYASVPTVIFPDDTYLTEPSYKQLREKLDLEKHTLSQRLKSIVDK
jgi:mycoredoxin